MFALRTGGRVGAAIRQSWGIPGEFRGNWGDLSLAEQSFVVYELQRGSNVTTIPTGRSRTPDFNISGTRVELKTISGVQNPNSNRISMAMASRGMDGRGQSGHVVLDLRNQAGITRDIADRGIIRLWGADNANGRRIQSIRVVGPDFDYTVPRRSGE